jgi:hypothetical protein
MTSEDQTHDKFIQAVTGEGRHGITRIEALRQAREFVADLYAVKNDRGYPRFSGTVDGVLAQELRIAAFLLAGDDDGSGR